MSESEETSSSELGKRISDAKAALEPEKPSAGQAQAMASVWRMTLDMVIGTAFGFAIGWGLDSLFGTKPILMVVFGLLGFAAGIKLVMDEAKRMNERARDE
ncbi:MAG: AtpZ/AtpI family protein [Neomegalonema sp.]|nr:AtpZ/AtpI family protein [Neomegalonema sp.]